MRGWVTVTVATDEPERRFAAGSVVYLDDLACEIAQSRLNGTRVALRLDGCTDRTQAESLRGSWLYVDVGDEGPMDPDEFYDHQLVGLDVQVEGRSVGAISEVLHLPGQEVLAVDLASGRQVLVPFVKPIVPVVDLSARMVEVVAMEGLLDDAD